MRLDLLPSGPHASQVGVHASAGKRARDWLLLEPAGADKVSLLPRLDLNEASEVRVVGTTIVDSPVRHADHPASRANLALFPPLSASTQAVFLRQGSPLNCSMEAQGKASAGHRHLVLCNIPALTCLSDTSQTHPSVVARHLFLVFRAAAARAQ